MRFENTLLYSILICYIIILLYILFLSRISSAEASNRSINLVPFASIKRYLFSNSNVIGNIVLFVPLGIYLPLLTRDKKLITNFAKVFLTSLFAEVIQGVFNIGIVDIDDVILNCAGGLIGILVHKVLMLVLRGERKVRIAVTILSTIVGIPIVIYLLFFIKLRM